MVYNIENQLSFGLCPSYWIKYKNIKNHEVSEDGSSSVFRRCLLRWVLLIKLIVQ
jgi:hypothetical protein